MSPALAASVLLRYGLSCTPTMDDTAKDAAQTHTPTQDIDATAQDGGHPYTPTATGNQVQNESHTGN
jgi:hypothetical protein